MKLRLPLGVSLAVFSLAFAGCSDSSEGTSGPPNGGSGGAAAGASGSSTSGGTGGGDAGSAGTGGTAGTGGSFSSGGSGAGGGVTGGAPTGGAPTGGSGAGPGGAGTGPTGGFAGAGNAGDGGQAGVGAGGAGQAGRGGGAGGQVGRGGAGQAGAGGRSISFGTLLDAQAVMTSAQALARSVANPNASNWRAKGDQHRTYRFAEANADEPYRLYVPTNWDGTTSLPLAMFLHGSGSNESTYVDQNNKQMLTLAQQHGFLLVSPLGDRGAYGNFLRLTAQFGDEAGAAALMAAVTADTERTNQLSEKDVINVLELVLNEYPIDREAMFLFGHSMGSGGTWYIGGKYAGYWRGIAPMSGPFVQKMVYPWDVVRTSLSIFVTEGTQTPSIDASRVLRDWLTQGGFQSQYEEVNADHGGMVSLVMPHVFEFFHDSRMH